MSAGLAAMSRKPPEDGCAEVIPHPGVRDAFTAYVGMVVFLASWAMMFASFFFAYGLVRAHAEVWPPLDQPPLPLGLPGANVGIAAASSAFLGLALRALRAGRVRRAATRLGASAVLGLAFLGLQSEVWASLWRAGLRPDGGPYASVFYGLTAIHALHVVVGLGALVVLTARAARGRAAAALHLPVRLWSMYWHFVGVVWAAIYAAVYVL